MGVREKLLRRVRHGGPKDGPAHADNEGDAFDLDAEPPEVDSPYPEVRAAVSPVDDWTLPQATIRMWVIGLSLSSVATVADMLLEMHAPSIGLYPYLVTIAAWPLGRMWEIFVPTWTVWGIPLNPGPFNLKEHALITILALSTLGSSPSYGVEIIITLEAYYKEARVTAAFQFMVVISVQLLGLCLAGLARRIIVYPAVMVWPTALVNVTLLTNIHSQANYVANGWRISRLRLFTYVTLALTVYQWLPGFLAPFLSQFNFGPWIAPKNLIVNQLFGAANGLGYLPISFDWNQASGYFNNPLLPPLGTFINFSAALVLLFWIVVPIIHYTNTWWGHYLPISSFQVLDRFQQPYDVMRVSPGGALDVDEYKRYSPLYMSTASAVSYGVSFASIMATVTHTLLFDLKVMRRHLSAAGSADDVHMRLMRRYPEVPQLAYIAVGVIALIMMAVLSTVYSRLGIPALILSIVLPAGLLIPILGIYALTNVFIALNVLTEFIIGYIQPGRPLAVMLFKTFGYYTTVTGLGAGTNMKMGHYIKIAPRNMFVVQIVGAAVGGSLQAGTLIWARAHLKDFCAPNQTAGFTCPGANVFYTASAIWGLIGSKRILHEYHALLYFFLLGAALPILSWLVLKRWPRSLVRYIHWPIFFSALAPIPPGSGYTLAVFCLVGFAFSFWVRRYWFNWWAKYNYTLAVSLDMGVAIGQLLIYVVSTAANIQPPTWWGTVGYADNLDSVNAAFPALPEGGSFGPTEW